MRLLFIYIYIYKEERHIIYVCVYIYICVYIYFLTLFTAPQVQSPVLKPNYYSFFSLRVIDQDSHPQKAVIEDVKIQQTL
jgi:glycopeptide antibiotics resistance protein